MSVLGSQVFGQALMDSCAIQSIIKIPIKLGLVGLGVTVTYVHMTDDCWEKYKLGKQNNRIS